MGCGQRLGHVTELQMSVDKAPIEIILPSTSPTQYHTGTQSKTDLSKATSLGCYTPGATEGLPVCAYVLWALC